MHPDLQKLKDIISHNSGNKTQDIDITRFKGGYSNLSYLLQINGDKKYVLRTAPPGVHIKSGHDMYREFSILQKLKPHFFKVPEVFLFSNDHSITGADFYIMEFVDGYILRATLPENQLPDKKAMSTMSAEFLDTFTEVHNLDVNEAGLADIGKTEDYIDRQVKGWIGRYQKAETHTVTGMDTLKLWLDTNQINGLGRATLIHNDFKFDNIIYDFDHKIKAVLDWEMSTIGEPLMDLGSSLAYWIDPEDPDWFQVLNINVTTLPGNYCREEVLHHYALRSGTDPGNGVFIYAFGLFKLAVIAQQIYKRFKDGKTNDNRFAQLDKAVQACVTMANQAIQKNRIYNLFTV